MDSCVFCRIVKGSIPSTHIYEDDHSLAFLDIGPIVPGHTLVIPKAHSTNIFDVSPEDWHAVTETARKVAIALDVALVADGVNVMMNNREHAGQTVHHPHIHLIPRFKGDGFTLWPHGSYADGEAAAVAEKIKEAL
jgi:histidine triad (HIT) family protein